MRLTIVCALGALLAATPVAAHDITAASDPAVDPAFDITHATATTDGRLATFAIEVSGAAGASVPAPTGQLAGAKVDAYVWPTKLDPGAVGFAPASGLLALAITAHPDFDDTPLFDENGDGKRDNDGDLWHSHWVVLRPDAACGKDALKVVDIPEGSRPRVPRTWPGLPILIDSPGWSPTFDGGVVEVRVPFDDVSAVEAGSFDGVTAALRVNASVHDPLLCVADVFKVASGDLSLPGRVNR